MHGFSYVSLTDDQSLIEAKEIEAVELNELHEGVSQNTYLFVQEKDILQSDVRNACLYFRHTEIAPIPSITDESKVKKFPFTQIIERLNYIIQKYQEQPALLDSVMDPIVLPLMGEVNLYLEKFMKQSLLRNLTSPFSYVHFPWIYISNLIFQFHMNQWTINQLKDGENSEIISCKSTLVEPYSHHSYHLCVLYSHYPN